MAIKTRNNWNGNEAQQSFTDVKVALEYMKKNPCYEIIPTNSRIRPYGDIDYKVDSSMSEEEFNRIDNEIGQAVTYALKDEPIAQFSASSYEYRKISHRWVLPCLFVNSVKDAKRVAVEFYKNIVLPEGVSGDMAVYSSLRKLRTLWTSKPNENRPFFMIKGTEEDHLVSYIPEKATEFILPKIDEIIEVVKPTEEYESSYIEKLCDCISTESWKNYTTCQSLIFSLLSLNAPDNIIHKYCKKGDNYDFQWVNNYIINYKPEKNKHSVGTLKMFAKQDSPAEYKALKKNVVYASQVGKSAFEEMTRLTTNETTLQDWFGEGGFLKPLPNHRTVAVKSHLGTGKTRRCIEACTPSPWNTQADKILIISPRQTFTTHISAELKGFQDYRQIKDKQINTDKVVVQLQSLHRCSLMQPRDLLLLDEVESILSALTPNKTHKHYLETIKVFESLIKSAKRVIVLDAFLTDRSIEMLKTLRGEVQIVINPTQPYKKTATLVSEQDLYENIESKLEDGKRIVSIWGAKNKGKMFHSAVDKKIKQVLYTGDSDAKTKETHLANVDKYWAEHQFVGYTATITVGINYNGVKFDEACVYATPWSCPSRDYIQALHRARKLEDNHITIYINNDPRPCILEAGLEEQEKQFLQNIERVKMFLKDIGQSPVDYTTLPSWLHRVLMWNTNEIVTNYSHFPECMKGYMTACGITYSEDVEESRVKSKTVSTHISVIDVADIEYEQAEVYSRSRQILTDRQRYELEKFYMKLKVNQVDDTIWTAWLDNSTQVKRSWAIFNQVPEDMIKDKVVDLVPKDAERLKIVQDLGLDWDICWDLPIDTVPKVDLTVFGQRLRSQKDSQEQYCRDLSKALKNWCGIEIKVARKRVSKGETRGYTYTLHYDPQGQLLTYMNRKLTVIELFKNEE